jgi:hypothetical protein
MRPYLNFLFFDLPPRSEAGAVPSNLELRTSQNHGRCLLQRLVRPNAASGPGTDRKHPPSRSVQRTSTPVTSQGTSYRLPRDPQARPHSAAGTARGIVAPLGEAS